MTQDILKQLGLPPFYPLPGLNKGIRQTIASYYFPYNPFINNDKQHVVRLACQDNLVLVENTPANLLPQSRTILLLHGLTGSHQSRYLIRATKYFLACGYRIIRMNLRGCGPGAGLARKLYHSGRSGDARAVVKWLAQQFPLSPVTIIGFSLGANIVLKMAGEDGAKKSGNLDSVVAISPPLDLEASVKLLGKKQNKILDNFYVKCLLRDMAKHHAYFPDLPVPTLPPINTVYDFDEYYTAPQSGFKNAHDYYSQSSSGQFLETISLPTLLMYAKDDPVISRRQFLKLPHHPNIRAIITAKGGHVGWLGKTDQCGQFRWMDRVIEKWVTQFDKHKQHTQ